MTRATRIAHGRAGFRVQVMVRANPETCGGRAIDQRHSPPIHQDPQKPPRIAYLESIRGLAALQVLLLHFFAAFAPDLVFALPAGAAVAAAIHLSPLYFLYDGYSAVYIFFALSGYVLSRSF
jgi:uncharacterized membrane protein YcfT